MLFCFLVLLVLSWESLRLTVKACSWLGGRSSIWTQLQHWRWSVQLVLIGSNNNKPRSETQRCNSLTLNILSPKFIMVTRGQSKYRTEWHLSIAQCENIFSPLTVSLERVCPKNQDFYISTFQYDNAIAPSPSCLISKKTFIFFILIPLSILCPVHTC